MGAAEAIALLMSLLDRVQAWATVINTAHAEGRDVTEAEVQAFADADDAARKLQVEAIARRRANP